MADKKAKLFPKFRVASSHPTTTTEQLPPFSSSKSRTRSRSPRQIKKEETRSRSRSRSRTNIILPPHLAAHPACFDAVMYLDDKGFREAWDGGVEAYGKDWEGLLRWARVGRQIAPASTEMRFRHAFALERLCRYDEAIDITMKEGDAGLNSHPKEIERHHYAITRLQMRCASLAKGEHYQELAAELTRDLVIKSNNIGSAQAEWARRDLCRYASLTEVLGRYEEAVVARGKIHREYDKFGNNRGAALAVIRHASMLFRAGWFFAAKNALPSEAVSVRRLTSDIERSKTKPVDLRSARDIRIMTAHGYCHYKLKNFKKCLEAADLIHEVGALIRRNEGKSYECENEFRLETTDLCVRALTELGRFADAARVMQENSDLGNVLKDDISSGFALLRAWFEERRLTEAQAKRSGEVVDTKIPSSIVVKGDVKIPSIKAEGEPEKIAIGAALISAIEKAPVFKLSMVPLKNEAERPINYLAFAPRLALREACEALGRLTTNLKQEK